MKTDVKVGGPTTVCDLSCSSFELAEPYHQQGARLWETEAYGTFVTGYWAFVSSLEGDSTPLLPSHVPAPLPSLSTRESV